MFTLFSERLYRQCVHREFRLPEGKAEERTIAASSDWTIWKAENASLCFLRVIDCDHANWAQILSMHQPLLERLEESLPNFRSVMLLYVLVTAGENPAGETASKALETLTQEAEPYWGQTLYTLFWRVRLDTKTISVSKGQPHDLIGLRGLIEKALSEAGKPPERVVELTFGDVRKLTEARSPYKPVLEFTWATYALLAINAIVLLLIYLDGYPSDALAPMRFGAIVPELVYYRQEYYRLFTAMFVHFGVMHFLMNAFGLLLFGGRVERFLGRVKFLLIYGLSGVSGAVFSLLFTRGYAAGASGAIFGLLGAVWVYTRISKRSMEQLDSYAMLLFIGMGLAMGFAVPNIDNFGHIGGLLMGMGTGAILTRRPARGSEL